MRHGALTVLAAAALAVAVGCGPRSTVPCATEPPRGFAAAEDSLGLDAFLTLPADQRASRRRAAARLFREAGPARPDRALALLVDANGLAPDDPDQWLAAARLWRWLGDHLRTRASLDAAAAAVRAWGDDPAALRGRGPAYKEDAALRIALERAWMHDDRAETREALPWVRAALGVEAGNTDALRLRGLLEATLGRKGKAEEITGDLHRKDPFTSDVAWITSRLEIAAGRDRAAYNAVDDLRPDETRAAECYRDMGRIAERVGDLSTAARWYKESFAALPLGDTACLRRLDAPRIGDGGGRAEVPFWLSFGRYYVTGSLSAYLSWAMERFEGATGPAAREEWGGLVVDAAGTAIRLDMETAYARRLRGLVFAGTGRIDRALDDLRAAAREFGPRSPLTPPLEAEIGHLHLLREEHEKAMDHLKRALVSTPDQAQAWSDFGLAQVMAGRDEEARAAFDRALELDPTLTEAWYNRGLMLLHAGDLAAARSDLAQAAALAPDNVEIARLLQQLTRRLRDLGTDEP